MKNIYSITAVVLTLGFSSMALAAPAPQGSSYMETAINKLPASDAAQFHATMQSAHEKNMALANQMHGLHDDLDAIVTAEPFDQNAFLAKSKQLGDLYGQMRENTDEAFAAALAQLSQPERATLAKAMSYPHPKHHAAQ